MMRVTGGRVRGRRLATFKGLDIRPTSDLVREAIFDLLGQDFSGARALDLFAGTGSLGIEALSRGAAQAVFIDQSGKVIELIRKNLKLCGLEERGFTLRMNLLRGWPRRHPLLEEGFALIFMDPPYGKGYTLPLLDGLQQGGLVEPAALVVVQTEKREDVPEGVGNLKAVKIRTYGATRITVLKNEEDS
jgi:16S rRNA (guanine966-N2)-methyltransferase